MRNGDREKGMRASAEVLDELLRHLAGFCRPYENGAEIDRQAEAFLDERGASSPFFGLNFYPAHTCVGANIVASHGIPDSRFFQEGDLVTVDAGCRLGEWVTDAAFTVPIGTVADQDLEMLRSALRALRAGIEQARPGNRSGDVSAAIEREIRAGGCNPVKGISGHGVGRVLHEEIDIPNEGVPGTGQVLEAGMTLALEPILTRGSGEIENRNGDGWTMETHDRARAAQMEATVLVRERKPAEVLVGPFEILGRFLGPESASQS